MAELHTVTCDQCGVTKGEANHWFKAVAWEVGHFEIMHFNKPLLATLKEQPEHVTYAEILHLCSEQCAAKAMSKAIGSGKDNTSV